MFRKYCTKSLFAQVLIVFFVVSRLIRGGICVLRRYCTRVHFQVYSVTQLCIKLRVQKFLQPSNRSIFSEHSVTQNYIQKLTLLNALRPTKISGKVFGEKKLVWIDTCGKNFNHSTLPRHRAVADLKFRKSMRGKMINVYKLFSPTKFGVVRKICTSGFLDE